MEHANVIYQSIGASAIRLLSIKPALVDEQIECALITIDNLSDAPPFEALSYVWGQDQSPHPIICNGVRKSVTSNLDGALRYLRPLPDWDSVSVWSTQNSLHSSHNVWRSFARNRREQRANQTTLQSLLWVDAICINQNDVAERANQVKLMGGIYQRASQVKIWLGDGGANMPVVFRFIAQALRNIKGQQEKLSPSWILREPQCKNHMFGLPEPTDAVWKEFGSFLANPWFDRVWIV